MGYFSNSTSSESIDMPSSIKVVLDTPGTCFTNYSEVSGLVEFDNEATGFTCISSISIQLVGISKISTTSFNQPEKRYFFQKETIVFPPSDYQQLLSSKKLYSLPVGQHTFPFSFTFPGKQRLPCTKDIKQHIGFLKNEPEKEFFYLPPSFVFERDNDTRYAKIQYFIVAVVKASSAFKSSLVASKRIHFAPTNDFLRYSIASISSGSQELYSNLSTGIQHLDFTAPPCSALSHKNSFVQSLRQVSLGRLSKPKCLLPIALQMRYLPYWNARTYLGESSRVVQPNVNANQFLAVSLVFPPSAYLQLITPSSHLASSSIYISYIRVELHTSVLFKAQTTMSVQGKEVLHMATNIHQNVPLEDFIKVVNDGTIGFPNTPKTGVGSCLYKYNLPAEYLDFAIPENCPSFVTNNVKRDYSIKFILCCYTSTNPDKPVILQAESAIVLLNDEDDIYSDVVDPLPLYTKTP